MAFTAKIPEHIIFNTGPFGHKTNKFKPNSHWQRLPKTHTHQKDAKANGEMCLRGYCWAPTTKKEVEGHKSNKNVYIHENKPTKLRLVGWQKEAMQAAIPTGHVVELPLDILYNAIRNDGFEKDNKTLKGKFVFSMVNRKLIPIKVGSGIHKAVLERIEANNEKKLKVKELVVGNFYKTPAGSVALFLGYVNTETMVVDIPRAMSRWNSRGVNRSSPVEDFGVRFLKKKLATLWYESRLHTWSGERRSPEQLQESLKADISNSFIHRFKCKKSHRYTRKIENFYVEVPTNVVTQVRNIYTKVTEELLLDARKRRAIGGGYYTPSNRLNNKPDHIRHYDAIRAMEYSAECNMTLFGLGFIRSDLFKQFEPWETKKKKYDIKTKKQKA